MDSEYTSPEDNNTWTLFPRPDGGNVVSWKWVFKVKEEQKPDGTLGTRRISRLVACGISQVDGMEIQVSCKWILSGRGYGLLGNVLR